VVGVLAAVANLDVFVELTNIGTLFAFVLVCAGVLILRYRDPMRPRPFRTPLVPFVPIAGILICLYLMKNLPVATWIRFGVWLAVGLVLYFFYGYRHSRFGAARAVPRLERSDRVASSVGKEIRAGIVPAAEEVQRMTIRYSVLCWSRPRSRRPRRRTR
jgi:amino acid transporter